MKNIILLFFFPLLSIAQITTSPSTIEVDQSVTITVDINSSASDCNGINSPNKVYLHSGVGDDSDPWGFNVIGNWGQDDGNPTLSAVYNLPWTESYCPFKSL